MDKLDKLNKGYLAHGILYKCYTIIDYLGYKFVRRQDIPAKLKNKRLLFINLGLIGDLILFRYVIDDFLKLNYAVDILIQKPYEFIFADLIKSSTSANTNAKANINVSTVSVLTVSGYKDKKIIAGFFKIFNTLRQWRRQKNYKYAAACHFRGYLGTGILATYLSGIADCQIGYGTAGFGFLLNHKVEWQPLAHETVHLLDILRVIEPQYKAINLHAFDNKLETWVENVDVLVKYQLSKGEYVVIHATSQNNQKNIPPSILKYTVDYLLNNSLLTIIMVGAAGDEYKYVENCLLESVNKSRIVFTNGQIGLFAVRDLVKYAKFFVGIDSSIAHLASALKLPKIILWHRLNLLSQWHPLGDDFFIIEPSINVDSVGNKAITNKEIKIKDSIIVDLLVDKLKCID